MSTVTWISTAEQLPDGEAAELVLIVFSDRDGREVAAGFYDVDCWRYPDAWPIDDPVSHWAHLPEPPAA